jgi:hypothetical protein
MDGATGAVRAGAGSTASPSVRKPMTVAQRTALFKERMSPKAQTRRLGGENLETLAPKPRNTSMFAVLGDLVRDAVSDTVSPTTSPQHSQRVAPQKQSGKEPAVAPQSGDSEQQTVFDSLPSMLLDVFDSLPSTFVPEPTSYSDVESPTQRAERRANRKTSILDEFGRSVDDLVTAVVGEEPSSASGKPITFRIEVHSVKDLPNNNLFGSQSPYVCTTIVPRGEKGGFTEAIPDAGSDATWPTTSKNTISLHLQEVGMLCLPNHQCF